MSVAFLDTLIDYEKITTYAYDAMKLGRMRLLLERLGNPHLFFQSIHVAGSRGKGSVSAMVYTILREAGFSVGLYTSPHLLSRLERIRISKKGEVDRTILEEELEDLIAKIRPRLEPLSKRGEGPLTFFEFFTALSFLFFKEKKIDIAVVEVGMGGRLDATNVVEPLVAAVTPISYDHTDKLGTTLTAIAGEKAQILKRDSVAIVAHQEPEALKAIRDHAETLSLDLLEVASSYSYQVLSKNREGTSFDVKGPHGHFQNLFIPLLGEHQVRNALVAIAICEALSEKKIFVSKEAVQKGLAAVQWPGRFQIVSENPTLIVDGAQDGASASVVKETYSDLFKDRPLYLILGISANKEIEAICKMLCPLAEVVIVTQADSVRALGVESLKRYAFPYSKRLESRSSLQEALLLAHSQLPSDGVILVTGSLYLVGEALALFQ